MELEDALRDGSAMTEPRKTQIKFWSVVGGRRFETAPEPKKKPGAFYKSRLWTPICVKEEEGLPGSMIGLTWGCLMIQGAAETGVSGSLLLGILFVVCFLLLLLFLLLVLFLVLGSRAGRHGFSALGDFLPFSRRRSLRGGLFLLRCSSFLLLAHGSSSEL